ncbi:MAG TPA: BrnT family toxin [Acidobacteriota bacterium]|nr:BrnT family toxin [Acidobacteriota bacterium]
MKFIVWNPDKNDTLKAQRGISFEDVVFHIRAGDIIETVDHPNQDRYPGQQIHVIEIEGYVYLVPFVESDEEVFLKTIIPSRKATKKHGGSKDE